MELPEQYQRDILTSVLEYIGLDPSSRHEILTLEAHLLLSSLYRVTVHYKDHDKPATINFIFKCLRRDPEMNEKFNTPVFFRNETMFYTKVAMEFEEFQKRRLSEDQTPFHSYPTCYKALSDGKKDIIVLEDLKERGYVLLNRFKVMDIPELFLMMKELGRFHALSLALKDKDPAVFAKLKMSTVQETVFYKEHLEKCYGGAIAYAASDILKLAKEAFPSDSPYVIKLEKFTTNNITLFIKDLINSREEDEQYNVFTHGDLWINNFLFHYEENGISKNPDKMCFVDFQQCRYGSLALDISAVLFLLMDQKLRDSHRDELLQAYHQSLSKFLRQLGCDPEQLFPFSALEVQLSKYTLFSLGMIFLLPYWLDEAEGNEQDITVEDGCEPGIAVLMGPYSRKTEECCKRILDVIKEFVDCGYLE